MCRTLTSHANLADIQYEARDLLHGLRKRDNGALRRYHALDPLADAFVPRLGEAQYVIAREYGYVSWGKLKENVNRHPKILNQARSARQTPAETPVARNRNAAEVFANS